MSKVEKTEAEWRTRLNPMEYSVCREQATESPFSGEYNDCKKEGEYRCKCCGAHLFDSAQKYSSGSGWPTASGSRQRSISLRSWRCTGLYAVA